MATLVVGVGTRAGAPAGDLARLVDALLRDLGAGAGSGPGEPARVGCVATAERKAAEPAIVSLAAHLGVPLVTYADPQLAAQPVAAASATVARRVGVPSVAEAAVLTSGCAVLGRARSSTAVVVVGRREGAPGAG
ncbi:cobalamin biosynthesis protein [Arsenicicoccus sp. oral taxon 190]|uniref:cobalamin biosynthesis protein n=1 Tax=Arsenicicoccus sp. oral taxon 190 TaxID=1658671 RepID=UPI00067A10AB|nr:cobalamin biosynthesis protein [Arsenicicoccus sp. oral taxon 190]AKT52091.1 hypothetical protein ADJ73_13835 [Arsenicicoccus sp. oral taxon 190]